MKFISVGFGNMVCADRIVAVVSPDSSPVKRLIQDAKDGGRVIDASCGRKTRAVLVLDSDHVVLSALQLQDLREHPAVPYEEDEVTGSFRMM